MERIRIANKVCFSWGVCFVDKVCVIEAVGIFDCMLFSFFGIFVLNSKNANYEPY